MGAFCISRVSGTGDVGVGGYESTVEVGEAEEGLNVLDFPWRRPVADDLNLRVVHSEAVRAYYESQEVRSVDAEGALLDFGEEVVFAEAS
jgi:hypothetical protein